MKLEVLDFSFENLHSEARVMGLCHYPYTFTEIKSLPWREYDYVVKKSEKDFKSLYPEPTSE